MPKQKNKKIILQKSFFFKNAKKQLSFVVGDNAKAQDTSNEDAKAKKNKKQKSNYFCYR